MRFICKKEFCASNRDWTAKLYAYKSKDTVLTLIIQTVKKKLVQLLALNRKQINVARGLF